MAPLPNSLVAGQKIAVSGKTTGGLKGSKVKIQISGGKKWKTIVTVKSEKKTGKWTANIRVPRTIKEVSVRAISGKKITKVQKAAIVAPLNLVTMGPGSRILGVDLSRWQSSEQPIDFKQMATAGVAFTFIKGSDGLASEDALAIPHVTKWAPAAKTAGILVGYYHFARIPVTDDPKVVARSARMQARQAAARLDLLGGYDDRTLPYVLDVESVDSKVTDEMVTLWTLSWLRWMQQLTDRAPIVYSYRSFLQNRFVQDEVTIKKLRNYHLWLAQPGNPARGSVHVGQGLDSAPCYESAWKQSDCSYVWTFWQYTSRGDRETFGIPWHTNPGDCPTDVTFCFPGPGSGRKHLDLNVFNGSTDDLLALVNGTWVRSAAEYH
jgi:GH25 family lysozyme M1 (1,4-beta-N-acetylmuramidase)